MGASLQVSVKRNVVICLAVLAMALLLAAAVPEGAHAVMSTESWGEWGSWSGWQTDAVAVSDSR